MNWRSGSSRSPIGVDIGRRYIKAVQLRGNALAAWACIPRAGDGPLKPGDIENLCQAVFNRPFHGRSVVLATPPEMLLTGVLELPPRSSGAPVEQLARLELARMHRREPATLEVACWDLAGARGGNRNYVMTMACGHAEAEGLLGMVEGAGFDVLALDVHATAAARACENLLGTAATAILDIGWSAAQLVLMHAGAIVYERPLDHCGLEHWVSAAARGTGGDEVAAETVVRDQGFDATDASGIKVAASLAGPLETLVSEMRIPLSYLLSQYPDSPAERLLLIGGGACLRGLPEKLTAALELPTSAPQLTEMCRCPASAQAAPGSLLAVALGLAKYSDR